MRLVERSLLVAHMKPDASVIQNSLIGIICSIIVSKQALDRRRLVLMEAAKKRLVFSVATEVYYSKRIELKYAWLDLQSFRPFSIGIFSQDNALCALTVPWQKNRAS